MSNGLDGTEGVAGLRNEVCTIGGGLSVVSNELDGTDEGAGFRNELCAIEGDLNLVSNGLNGTGGVGGLKNEFDVLENGLNGAGGIGLRNVLSFLAIGFLKSFDCITAGKAPPPAKVQNNMRISIILS